MKVRSLISPLALAAALVFSGQSAFAQTVVGGVEVSAADLGRVQEACNALASAQTQSLAGDKAVAEGTQTNDSAQSGSPDPAAAANVDLLLTTLTAEQCQEANLVSASSGAVVSGDAMAAAPVALSATDAEVIEACAALRASANESAAGDKATTEGTVDPDASGNASDPASKQAQISALTVEQCTTLGL